MWLRLQEEYPDKFVSAVQGFLAATSEAPAAGLPGGMAPGSLVSVADTTPAAAAGTSEADAEAV